VPEHDGFVAPDPAGAHVGEKCSERLCRVRVVDKERLVPRGELLSFGRRRGRDPVSITDVRVVDGDGALSGKHVAIDTEAVTHARHDGPDDGLDLRCWIVGESMPEVVVFTTALTSCSISSCTRPLSLMRGVTDRITPVSCIVIELTIAVLAVTVLVAVWVVIGTWSPI